MNIGELTEICKKLSACPDGIRWLETFDESDSVIVALNGLRLYNRGWLLWFIYRIDTPYPLQPSFLRSLRTAYTEYAHSISARYSALTEDNHQIFAASPVNLDQWEKRVAQYEAENAESWKDFKFKITYDFEMWADYLYYYLKGR
jgi:hypothetical protein